MKTIYNQNTSFHCMKIKKKYITKSMDWKNNPGKPTDEK